MFVPANYQGIDTEGDITASQANLYESIDHVDSEISDDILLPDIKMKSIKRVEFEREMNSKFIQENK